MKDLNSQTEGLTHISDFRVKVKCYKKQKLQANEKKSFLLKKEDLAGSNLSEKQNATTIALRILKELWP